MRRIRPHTPLINEKGVTIVLVAILMTVLVMFVALAVDLGHLYVARNELQNAADAGALAGAHELYVGSNATLVNEGANQIGVAPGAQWIGCRNMDQGWGTPATYMECFEFFLAPYPIGQTPAEGEPALAPDVINNSWGCPPREGSVSGAVIRPGRRET